METKAKKANKTQKTTEIPKPEKYQRNMFGIQNISARSNLCVIVSRCMCVCMFVYFLFLT